MQNRSRKPKTPMVRFLGQLVCSLCKGAKTVSRMVCGEWKREHYIAVPCPQCQLDPKKDASEILKIQVSSAYGKIGQPR
jgi:hypothetical protein